MTEEEENDLVKEGVPRERITAKRRWRRALRGTRIMTTLLDMYYRAKANHLIFEVESNTDMNTLGTQLRNHVIPKNTAITERVRAVLLKEDGQTRKKAEVEQLAKLLSGKLRSFSRYTLEQRVRFCKIMDGRVILKEGHLASSFYFILSGQVEVFKIRSGIKYRLNILNAGDHFGERAIRIPKDRRKACISTTVPTELLRIHKSESYLMNKRSISKIEDSATLALRKSQLQSIPHFADCGSDAIDKILPLCEFTVYEPNQLIVMQDSDAFQFFTLLSGTCRCVKIAPFVKRKGVLYAYDKSVPLKDAEEVVQQQMVVLELDVGDHFPNLPTPNLIPLQRELYTLQLRVEDPADNRSRASVSVIANTTVEVVSISRHHFVQYATEKVLTKLIEDSNIFKVPLSELQAAYLERLKWESFKKKVTTELQQRK
eukprot:jgi/Hompol1/1582/HPOL_004584-RA